MLNKLLGSKPKSEPSTPKLPDSNEEAYRNLLLRVRVEMEEERQRWKDHLDNYARDRLTSIYTTIHEEMIGIRRQSDRLLQTCHEALNEFRDLLNEMSGRKEPAPDPAILMLEDRIAKIEYSLRDMLTEQEKSRILLRDVKKSVSKLQSSDNKSKLKP